MNGMLQLTKFLEGAREHNIALMRWLIKLIEEEKVQLGIAHAANIARLNTQIENLIAQFKEQDEEFATVLGVAPDQIDLQKKAEAIALVRNLPPADMTEEDND